MNASLKTEETLTVFTVKPAAITALTVRIILKKAYLYMTTYRNVQGHTDESISQLDSLSANSVDSIN